ncbi:hypothetical protein FY526_29540, partial [Clostridioides difficile]
MCPNLGNSKNCRLYCCIRFLICYTHLCLPILLGRVVTALMNHHRTPLFTALKNHAALNPVQ